MDREESDYNYQVTTGGRAYGKSFFQSEIKQAYINGINDELKEKEKLIKYLEDKIIDLNNLDKSNTCYFYRGKKEVYQDILKRMKNDKYD